MDRYRLKNCIILILVLMNLFLLGSLVTWEGSKHSSRRTAAEQLSSLFAADGIALDPSVISAEVPPTGRTLSRDDDWEHRAAAALLGNDLARSDQGGGISTYSSVRGAAMFRSNGGFDAAGTLASDGVDFCTSFCRDFGYEVPEFQLNESNCGSATVSRLYEDLSVFNGTITFSITNGILTGVSGTLLPETSTETISDEQPLSASAALTTFQKLRRETQAVVSAVSDMYLCYELQSSAAVPMALVPAWCIVTDTSNYYVNCSTGVISSQ